METVGRVAFVYVLILALLRVMGKREVGQLTPMELVMLILIPELVSQAMIREDFSMVNGVVAVTTLMSLVFVTSALAYRFPKLERIVEGRPAMLVRDGEVVRETLDLERISADELASEMRQAGVASLAGVKWAILEPGGRVAIIRADGSDTPRRNEQALA
jgi:uncharacterized membrane protein YcaP (DUF421 family)